MVQSMGDTERFKAYSLLKAKIYKTKIMTSQKHIFIVFSKEQQNHDSETWIPHSPLHIPLPLQVYIACYEYVHIAEA